MSDKINHPSHYNQGKIEVYDFITDQKLDFSLGNVVKYVCRAKHKKGLEDLKKAQWYLNKFIKEFEAEEEALLKSSNVTASSICDPQGDTVALWTDNEQRQRTALAKTYAKNGI